jgi:DNA replication licensing factor MCM4
MVKDSEIEATAQLLPDHPGNQREYMDILQMMLELGVTALNLDMRNLKSYPPTAKLWYQMQHYPEEVVPVIDACIKDAMVDLAEKKVNEERQQILQQANQRAAGAARQRDSSSLPPVPSSDAPDSSAQAGVSEALAAIGQLVKEVEEKKYLVRPFALDKTINLRELNPGGK